LAIDLAAKLGYQAVGIRILPATPGGEHSPLIEQPSLVNETARRARATGVAIFDVEIVRITPNIRLSELSAFLDVCAALDAKAVLVAGDDPDEARLTASFADVCEAAARHGLSADLEFMPWTPVSDANTAVRIVARAGQPNGGVLVDALHAARSRTTRADIAAIPRAFLHYAQICDAPAEIPQTHAGLINTARNARLLPGDGGLDLAGFLRVLPADLPISIEIPNLRGKSELGIEEWARRALACARKYRSS
jgi:sugar phosphate isomerase/epimerase